MHPRRAPSGPPPTAPPLPAALAVLGGLVAAGCLATPVLMLAMAGPKFAEIFRDFGVQLPAHTRLLLGIGDSLWSNPLLLLATLTGLFAVAVVVSWLSRRRPFVLVLFIALCVVLALLLITLTVISFMLPMHAVQQSIQQNSAGP